MMEIRKKFLLHLTLAAFCWGCTSSATVPSPLAEVPASIQYPESVAVNLDTVSSPPAGGSLLKQFVGPGGEFSEEIAFGPDLTQSIQALVDAQLRPLNTLVIPVNTATHNLTATVDVPADPPGSGPSRSVLIQIDFSRFDFDGDGLLESCQGHTAALPICYRVWFDGQPKMAGLFDTFPDANRNGAGRFREKLRIEGEDGVARDVYLAVSYDQSDPLARLTEIFERFVLAGQPVENKDPDSFDSHAVLTQDGPEETAVKLLQFSANDFPLTFPQVTGKPNDLTYVGRWKEGQDFWSGTIVTHNVDVRNITNQCALISTGEGANAAHCGLLSINVDKVPPVPFLNVDDVRFPAFPPSPGF